MSNKKALGFNEEAARCEPEEICFHRVPHHSMDTVDTSHRPLTLWLYHNSPRRGEANEEATQTQAGGSLETDSSIMSTIPFDNSILSLNSIAVIQSRNDALLEEKSNLRTLCCI